MITILSKIFIKPGCSDTERREKLGMVCGLAGIILNILLFVGKLFAGFFSGSIAIMADALNNLSDAGSSIVTLLGFKLAAKEPDADHPYGHGRMEYIAGFIVAALILAMAFSLLKDSVGAILAPETLSYSPLVVAILLASIAVKLYMAYYNTSVSKTIGSAAIRAAATDSLSDCVATGVVLASTLLYHSVGLMIDGWCGLIVGLMIAYAGIDAARDTLNPLLGQPPEKEFVDRIADLVLHFDDRIQGMHDLMVHDYGPGRRIISLHAEVPADADIVEIHDVIDNLEHTLQKEIGCMATVHMDPIVTSDPRVAELRENVLSCVHEIDPALKIHDFRVVFGDSHTNLIFDVLAPMECALSDGGLCKKIQDRVSAEIGPAYMTVIDVDRDYSEH